MVGSIIVGADNRTVPAARSHAWGVGPSTVRSSMGDNHCSRSSCRRRRCRGCCRCMGMGLDHGRFDHRDGLMIVGDIEMVTMADGAEVVDSL